MKVAPSVAIHPFKAKSDFVLCLHRRVLTFLLWGGVLLLFVSFLFLFCFVVCLVFCALWLCNALSEWGFQFAYLVQHCIQPQALGWLARHSWEELPLRKSFAAVSSCFLLLWTFLTTPYISSCVLECLSHFLGHILNFSFKSDPSFNPFAPPPRLSTWWLNHQLSFPLWFYLFSNFIVFFFSAHYCKAFCYMWKHLNTHILFLKCLAFWFYYLLFLLNFTYDNLYPYMFWNF